MIIDENGPWTASCRRVGLPEVEHGVDQGTSLCGLPSAEIVIMRHAFRGRRPQDCRACTEQLQRWARARGWQPPA